MFCLLLAVRVMLVIQNLFRKSLMRMFGPGGNPTAENLLGVIGVLQAETGVHLEVRAVADAA